MTRDEKITAAADLVRNDGETFCARVERLLGGWAALVQRGYAQGAQPQQDGSVNITSPAGHFVKLVDLGNGVVGMSVYRVTGGLARATQARRTYFSVEKAMRIAEREL